MGQASSSPIPSNSASSCPIPHQSQPTSAEPGPAKCPIPHDQQQQHQRAPASSSDGPAKCPIDHGAINPDNQMPKLSQGRAPGQEIDLPTQRTESSIPRDDEGWWEYPSPQQFYNALVRKGWETPEEHVVTMVEIHNFLNEEAWEEVKKWERRNGTDQGLQLTRFKGRPGEMSPKARIMLLAGWLFPSRFNTEPPFDRHDWIVRRPGTGEEVRYVIDYYSAPPEEDGSPVFSLDVRPALDSVGSVQTRIAAATEKVWSSFRKDNGTGSSSSTSSSS